uniref:RING-type E3 ubiquitin transferase n=1 Tax=Clastoptera arizonana TaxID=38151 RepID=A0A1B6C8C0_9HEMI
MSSSENDSDETFVSSVGDYLESDDDEDYSVDGNDSTYDLDYFDVDSLINDVFEDSSHSSTASMEFDENSEESMIEINSSDSNNSHENLENSEENVYPELEIATMSVPENEIPEPVNFIVIAARNSNQDDSQERPVNNQENLDEDQENLEDDRENLDSQRNELISQNVVSIQEICNGCNVENITKPPSQSQGEKRSLDDSYTDDGLTCPICLDSFTNSGPHRISSLRCGHTFGHNCIERWLKVSCSAASRRCPTCNKKAAIKDIRILYAKKLIAIDNSDVERIKKELDEAKAHTGRLKIEVEKCVLKERELKKEIEKLKVQLTLSQKNSVVLSSSSVSKHSFKLERKGIFEISNVGGCRIMAYNNSNLVVSRKIELSNFPGFGLKVFDSTEFKPVTVVPLHSKMIRDMAFNKDEKETLLTVSLDTSAKLVDLRLSPSTSMSTYPGNCPLWSCCWDPCRTNIFYTGGQTGSVCQFDTRNLDRAITSQSIVNNRVPIISLSGVLMPPSSNHLKQSGIVCCSLNSVWTYIQEGDNLWMGPNELPINGPFMSMRYDAQSELLLTSSRPNNEYKSSRHVLNQITNNLKSCNLIHNFEGSRAASLMSRSCFMSSGETSTLADYIAAFSETDQKIQLYNLGSGSSVCSVPTKENIMDLCSINTNGACILAALSDTKLFTYDFKKQC